MAATGRGYKSTYSSIFLPHWLANSNEYRVFTVLSIQYSVLVATSTRTLIFYSFNDCIHSKAAPFK